MKQSTLKWCPDTDLFQTLTVSPEADRTAILSELKDSVLASVRWPPRVSRDVLVPVGLFSVVFTLYVSTVLFCSNRATFISPLGDRRQSTDLRKQITYRTINYMKAEPYNLYNSSTVEVHWPDLRGGLYIGKLLDLICQLSLHNYICCISTTILRPGPDTPHINKLKDTVAELLFFWFTLKIPSYILGLLLSLFQLSFHFLLNFFLWQHSKDLQSAVKALQI